MAKKRASKIDSLPQTAIGARCERAADWAKRILTACIDLLEELDSVGDAIQQAEGNFKELGSTQLVGCSAVPRSFDDSWNRLLTILAKMPGDFFETAEEITLANASFLIPVRGPEFSSGSPLQAAADWGARLVHVANQLRRWEPDDPPDWTFSYFDNHPSLLRRYSQDIKSVSSAMAPCTIELLDSLYSQVDIQWKRVLAADTASHQKAEKLHAKGGRPHSMPFSESHAEIAAIVASKGKAENKMERILRIDYTAANWTSLTWAETLGVSDSTIRMTDIWKKLDAKKKTED